MGAIYVVNTIANEEMDTTRSSIWEMEEENVKGLIEYRHPSAV